MGLSKASAIILAGGKSTRMGQDKASLPWGESDILQYLTATLQGICQEVIVVSNRPRQMIASARVVADIIPNQGPLSGIHAGLSHARYPQAFVIGCDMPFVIPGLVKMLLDKIKNWDVVVPIYSQKQQPLFASYSKTCIPAIETLLSEGDRRVISLFTRVQCHFLHEAEWSSTAVLPGKLFYNLNTYEEYQEARKYNESR
ncbi:molybdenum cofactor guanylyltransferase [Pelosinus sp. IPA-1]|uniref:molybdenum cofactor guanylyltransferase n=1 Tax=Pelosinus sp. IPA-1 TaxID=3029569 RepID=UPI0024361763|nr:molybdenum cofactor guanylyltransferase [Pelosinus sp. IPA-1]GMB01795.1 putative molybdenum cofactor guanylyltransferase [Pelosinus sp. IPA-1]